MRRLWILSGILLWPAVVPGQVTGNLVRITVQRCEKVDSRVARTVPPPNRRIDIVSPSNLNPPAAAPVSTVGIYYHVKVATTGTRPLTNLVVRWSILWQDATGQMGVREGAQSCDVVPLRYCEFETETVAIRPSWKIAADQTACILGYYIEAFYNGKPAGNASDPVGIKARIDHLRNERR
jgi:hypothetical protein